MCSLGELGFFGPGGGVEAGGGMARASIILGCATFVRGTVMVWVFGADSGFCVGYGTAGGVRVFLGVGEDFVLGARRGAGL